MHKKVWIVIIIFFILVITTSYFMRDRILSQLFRPTESSVKQGAASRQAVELVSQDLITPWSIAFLPVGDMMVTERSGQMKRIGKTGQTYPIAGVTETSEGGLLGIALHPDFRENSRLYLYFTTGAGGSLQNRVDEYTLADDRLTLKRTILTGIPAATNHNGGAIAFGPDKKLYVTTGDAAQEQLAQDTASLAGKILRINDDGSVPADNPYGNLTWSYGHRNPQGIAWDDRQRLWSVEHGPSGIQSGRDELNLIEKGANYGWPVITGDETRDGMRSPVAQSGDNDTWAPAGMAYVDGSLYFAGLRGQSLYRAQLDDEAVTLTRQFTEQYGRLRAVTEHDGALYVSTSNRDGRGSPGTDDDRILSIDPKQLRE